jgi:CRISPR/Cas system-associated exonuclease Cas4 (RecB family)
MLVDNTQKPAVPYKDEDMESIKLSPSSISSFQKCPRYYYWSKVLRLARKKTRADEVEEAAKISPLKFGTQFHEAMKRLMAGEEFADVMADNTLPAFDAGTKTKTKAQLEILLQSANNYLKGLVTKVYSAEFGWLLQPIEGVVYRGFWDSLIELQGTKTVLEIKTSGYDPAARTPGVHLDLQLRSYCIAASALYQEPITSGAWFCTSTAMKYAEEPHCLEVVEMLNLDKFWLGLQKQCKTIKQLWLDAARKPICWPQCTHQCSWYGRPCQYLFLCEMEYEPPDAIEDVFYDLQDLFQPYEPISDDKFKPLPDPSTLLGVNL